MPATIIAFGELLWDLLPDRRVLGGAPFNFAYRAAGLGNEAVMVSAVGADALGDEALTTVERLGLRTDGIRRLDAHPTGTVHVFFDEHRQPDYEIVEGVAYDHIPFDDRLAALAAGADCVCFGSLVQRAPESRTALHAFLDRADAAGSPLKLLDVNLRKNCYTRRTIEASLDRADVLKLNDDEADTLADMLGLTVRGLPDVPARLAADRGLRHVVVTLGAKGALAVSADGTIAYDPGYAIDLADPVGAGDAFTAGFAHQLLHGRTAADGCRLGNALGAIVATQHGGTTPVSSEDIARFLDYPPDRVRDGRFDDVPQAGSAPLHV